MEKEKFKYTYSAPTKVEREEIEDIRRDYAEKTDTEIKFERLKNLDRKVKTIPKLWAWVLGIIGVLIFGLGLTMVLEWGITIFGVLIGVIGSGLMIADYFIYKNIKKCAIKKYRTEILSISEELLKTGK